MPLKQRYQPRRDIMRFSRKHVNICVEEGFRKAFIQDGDLIAMFPGNGDENDTEMVVREVEDGFKAWVLAGPFGMRTPKNITRINGEGGANPVYRFKTVREAARLALNNPHY